MPAQLKESVDALPGQRVSAVWKSRCLRGNNPKITSRWMSRFRRVDRYPWRLRRAQAFEHRVERVGFDGAEHGLDIAVAVDQHESGLGWNVEADVDVALVVADLRERQMVAVDEVLEGRFVASPGDPVEVDLAGPLLARRFDRRGFTVAGASSRCPEPERERATGSGGAIELAAAEEGCREPQRIRNSGVYSGRCSCAGACVWVVRSTRDQRGRRRCDEQQQSANDPASTGQSTSHALVCRSPITPAGSSDRVCTE